MPNKKRQRQKKAAPPPRSSPPSTRAANAPWWRRESILAHWPRSLAAAAVGFLLLLFLFFFVFRQPAAAEGDIWTEFSGENALGHVQDLVDFGPRPAQSDAIKKTRDYLRRSLESNGWQVQEQNFTQPTPRGPVTFVNLIARRPNASSRVFLVGSHYDTKTFDDLRFVGANDGGSSTGALLEMARVLNQHPDLASRVELVFFDGEEAYEHFTRTDGLYGSRYFAQLLLDAGKVRDYCGGIVWDMMGDRNLTITLPPDSPPELARGIFAAADALQVRDHFTYLNDDMIDDHSPLNEAGIPTI
ncbi:MAG: M28 family peptidase, partial [Chthoniobacterales bacterium]